MDSITIRLLDPPRASLESPLSLKCCKNVGGTRNGRWCGTREPLRTHYPGKGRLRGLVLAASTDEEATSSSQVGGIDLEKAVQERLRKAQEYKTKKGAASTAQDGTVPPPSAPKEDGEEDVVAGPSSIAPAGFLDIAPDSKSNAQEKKPVIVPSRVAPEPERPEFSDRRLSQDDFQAKMNMGGGDTGSGFRAADIPDEEKTAAVEEENAKGRSGSSSESATFLKELFSEERQKELEDLKGERENMRAEDVAVIQEQEMKSRGAEVISVDKSYKPTISTWGLFPRPDNISKTYGGGKTIDPTKPLEEEDVKAKRDEEVMARLQTYRKGVGLDIEPEVEKKFNAVYSKAMACFKSGDLKAAYRQFDAASEIVDWATKPGGDADYHKAVCLDSLGENMKAKSMYTRLSKHPNPDVRKLSKRMLYGFSAMDKLKTHTISYKVGGAYKEYFRKISSSYDTTYYGEDDGDDNLAPLVALLGMTVMPLAIVYVLSMK